MTSPTTPTIDAPVSRPKSEPKAESFLDWFRINSKVVTIAAVVVAAAVFGFWFYTRSNVLKAENADRRLLAAKQSLGSGNLPLAQSDLKKVADQYPGTSAGAEAGMLLAQVKLEQNDNQGAIATLRDLAGRNESGPYASPIRVLLGDATDVEELVDAIDKIRGHALSAGGDAWRYSAVSVAKRSRKPGRSSSV